MNKISKTVLSLVLSVLMLSSIIPFGIINAYADEKWIFPVTGTLTVSSKVEKRWGKMHTGLDIPGKLCSVVASRSGTVVSVSNNCWHWNTSASGCPEPYKSHNNTYGNLIVIEHADGTRAYYGHLAQNTMTVSVGQYVQAGHLIAKTGSSGMSTGAHLHFEVREYPYKYGVNYLNINPDTSIYYTYISRPYEDGETLPQPKPVSTTTPKKAQTKENKKEKVTLLQKITKNANVAYKVVVNTMQKYFKQAASPIPTGTKVNVYSVSAKKTKSGNYVYVGKVKFNGKEYEINLDYVDLIEPVVLVPDPPVVTLTSAQDIALGELISVSWNTPVNANYYSAILKNVNGSEIARQDNIYDTKTAFQPPSAGQFTVEVIAHNSEHSSESGKLGKNITVHDLSTVTFVDSDGTTVLGVQKVAWGDTAVAPIAPEKVGYTFQNWSESLSNIKSDKTIKAQYNKTKYTVQFIGYTDERFQNEEIIKKETVEYGDNVTPPSAEEINVPNDNYEFIGWSSEEYNNVYTVDKKEPIKIYAVYAWKNKNLPIACELVSAVRQQNGYKLVYNLENYPDAVTRGRAIVALKTSEGKLIDMTESSAFSLEKGESEDNIKIFVPCEKAATTAEIFIINGYTNNGMSDGIPISNMDSTTIVEGKMWSDWQTDPIEETGENEVDSRIEYSFRNMREASANNNTKEGYICTNGTNPTQTSVSNWSGWQWNKIDGFDYRPQGTGKRREIGTQQAVASTNYKTQYNYNRWSNKVSGGSRFGPCAGTWNNIYCGNYQEYGWTDSPLPCQYTKYSGQVGGYYSMYGSDTNPWYNQWTQQAVASYNYGTQYRYRDYTYTYYFYRWDDKDWSAWSPEAITETDKRQVNTRTVYREKSVSAGIEDVSGEMRTFNGQVDADFAGKNIMMFVSKYNAISDFTDEYVAQTIIEEDGSYTFNYKLREEPSQETGDFTIMIGVEGTTEKQVVGKIEAPKPVYTVQFVDAEGNVIDEQRVTQGESAEIPTENPEVPGKTFVCWNNSCTNIQSDYTVEDDTAISPVYTDNVYTVVFVDWRKQTIEMQEYKYNEPLTPPTTEISITDTEGEEQTLEVEVEDVDSGYGIGWDYEEGTLVTSNMVVTAQYETKTFDVNFYDYEGNIVDSQTVEYNGVAEMPELPDTEGVDYYDWDIDKDELFGIKEDIAVIPNYAFSEDTSVPFASIDTGSYNGSQTVELSCEDENAVIYYTLDGSDPLENPYAEEYKKPIVISAKTELKFYASSLGKNNSEICSNYYVINNDGIILNVFKDTYDITDTYLLDSINDINESNFETEGFELEGVYINPENTEVFDFNDESLSSVLDVYAHYSIKKYVVTFALEDGTVIDTQDVEFTNAAEEPVMDDIGTKQFTGWDTDEFKCVTKDITVHPIYKEKSEIINVSFDRDRYRMDVNSTYQINATISSSDEYENINDALVWLSDDESIAVVDSTGEVTATGTGTTTIYALTVDDADIASIEITVALSVNDSIILNNLSTLDIDSEGYLRRIPLDGTNTVDEIASNLLNDSNQFTFTNAKGNIITGTDKVGTNTVISLMNGNEVLDSMTVVMTGDVTCDGAINNRDVSYAARVIVKRNTADAAQLRAMDVNGDGKVNNRDVAMLSRYLVGKEQISN